MKKALALIVSTVFVGTSLSMPAFGAVKAGAPCTKAGATSTTASKKFTCVKSGKKLVWNKGVAIVKPNLTPSPNSSASPSASPSARPIMRNWTENRSTDLGYITEFNGPCSIEKDLSKKFEEVQAALLAVNDCPGIYRIAKYELGSRRPIAALSSNFQDLNIKQCQIAIPNSSMSIRGFFSLFDSNRLNYMNSVKIPGPKMTIQIVPIYSSDTAKPTNSPKEDYSEYTDFLTGWAKYSSDVESNIDVKFPDKYISFPNDVSGYKIGHETRADSPEHVRFTKDLVAAVDSQINFGGANTVIVVVPPGTPLANFQQATLKDLVTQEGTIWVATTEYPLTPSNLRSVKFANFLIPYWWIHELFHSGIGLDDHYGDGQNNVNTEYGLGKWTLMSGHGGDLSAWEKWFVGFLSDDQVHCINPSEPTIRWIAPSSVKTKEKKLIVVPISQTKGIVIESIRAAGLYYKIPEISQGVLVYVVDLGIEGHGLGYKLVLPTNRSADMRPFFLSQATLRQGESVTTNGYKITIVESGTFGDVVKVERA